ARPWRTEGGDLIGELEARGREAEGRGRPAAESSGRAAALDALEHAPPHQHALKVGGGNVVAQGRDVDLAQLRDGERVRGEREADVRVRELCAETGARGADELPLVRRAGNGRVGKLPLGRDEAEAGGGERSVAQ